MRKREPKLSLAEPLNGVCAFYMLTSHCSPFLQSTYKDTENMCSPFAYLKSTMFGYLGMFGCLRLKVVAELFGYLQLILAVNHQL
jgi:hypothetical protein